MKPHLELDAGQYFSNLRSKDQANVREFLTFIKNLRNVFLPVRFAVLAVSDTVNGWDNPEHIDLRIHNSAARAERGVVLEKNEFING